MIMRLMKQLDLHMHSTVSDGTDVSISVNQGTVL